MTAILHPLIWHQRVPLLFIEAPQLFCIVPAATKANAVKTTVYDEINEECPAAVLRQHPATVLYLNEDSSSLL